MFFPKTACLVIGATLLAGTSFAETALQEPIPRLDTLLTTVNFDTGDDTHRITVTVLYRHPGVVGQQEIGVSFDYPGKSHDPWFPNVQYANYVKVPVVLEELATQIREHIRAR